MAGFRRRCQKTIEYIAPQTPLLDSERPLCAMKGAFAPVACLRFLEIGEAMSVGPSGKAVGIRPVIVVPGMPAQIDHCINRRRPAEYLAPGHRDAAALHPRLRLAFIVP